MKKKLMAIIIAASLIGGIGTTTYASVDTVKENVVLSNVNDESNNQEVDVNTSNNGTSSETNNNGAIKVNIKSMGFFKFINIKFNNAIVSIQDFFNSILGNKPNVDENTSNDNEQNSSEENSGQDLNNGQDNNEVKDESTEVTPPVDNSGENSQENVENPSTDVNDNSSDSNDNVNNNTNNNTNGEVNNNSNNTVKPNTPVVPENKPSTEVKPSTPSTPNTSVTDENFMATVEQMIFNKVNEERAKAGVAQLSYNNTMQKYARIKSQDMGDNNYFSHNDLSGNLITAKMKADGVSYKAWGENIAYIGGVSDATALANQFMTNWMNSQGHKDNILSTNFTSIGLGVYKVGNKVYATQEFYK